MPASKNNTIIVVGAGLSGLAAAARIAAQDKKVKVFEKNPYFGGKATLHCQGDFIFDAGPSLFTLPGYVDEVFESCGKNPRDYFQYHKLPVICNYFYEDGLRLSANADVESFAKEIENKTEDKAKSVMKFLRHSENIHQLTEQVFLRKTLHKLSSYLNWETLRGILGFHKIDAFVTMEKAIRRYFKDERVVQLFCRYATYNGSNPYVAPGTLNVIPHLEFGLGAYMPVGGIHAIPKALYRLAQDMGVEFHFNTPVDEIVVENGGVCGVRVGDDFFPCEKVITNADIWPSYRQLLNKQRVPEKILAQERSSSAFIFYWGMAAEFPELDVHNIFFSGTYKKEFDTLFTEKLPYNDPTVYVHVSSKICNEHAPAGKENWFVMVNAPRHANQDWEHAKGIMRNQILDKLERILQKPIRNFIENEGVLSPEMIQQKTASYQGSLYGPSSNGRYAAFLRHANFSRKIKGLYFCGGSVHPGGGIPLVMSSAKIVSDLIQQEK